MIQTWVLWCECVKWPRYTDILKSIWTVSWPWSKVIETVFMYNSTLLILLISKISNLSSDPAASWMSCGTSDAGGTSCWASLGRATVKSCFWPFSPLFFNSPAEARLNSQIMLCPCIFLRRFQVHFMTDITHMRWRHERHMQLALHVLAQHMFPFGRTETVFW